MARVVVVKSAVDVFNKIHDRQRAINALPVGAPPRLGERLKLGYSPQDFRRLNRPGALPFDDDVEIDRARKPLVDLGQTDARLGIRLGEMEVVYVDHDAARADCADHDEGRGQDVKRNLVRRGPAPDAFEMSDHAAGKPDAKTD